MVSQPLLNGRGVCRKGNMDELFSGQRTTKGNPRKQVLTPEEVAAELRVDVEAVKRGELRRKLKWLKLAGRLRLHSDDLEAFIEAERRQVSEPVFRSENEGVALRCDGEGEAVHGT